MSHKHHTYVQFVVPLPRQGGEVETRVVATHLCACANQVLVSIIQGGVTALDFESRESRFKP